MIKQAQKGGGLLVWIQIRPTHTMKNLTALQRKELDHAVEQVENQDQGFQR